MVNVSPCFSHADLKFIILLAFFKIILEIIIPGINLSIDN